jgi:hypothetical protein
MGQKTYAVPEGCKITSVDFQSGVIVYECNEPEAPKFKRGDFVYCEYAENGDKAILLFDKYVENDDCKAISGIGYIGIFDLSHIYSLHSPRLATPEEKQLLLDKMHEQGKDWDGENVVDWVWKPKMGEPYWYIIVGGKSGAFKDFWDNGEIDNDRLKGGRIFATEPLAKAAFTDLQELLKQAKKY